MRRSLALLLLLAGCGGDGGAPAPPATGAPAGLAAAATGAAPPAAVAPARAPLDVPWEDPEPAGAQALAESVAGSPFNAGKTTRLTMSMTTLVDRTTGLSGFRTGLAGRDVSLSERLDRLHAEVTEHEIVIRLAGSVLFDFDRADIRADAQRTLSEVAEVLAAHSGRPVRIEGHTDAIASDAYNQALSEKRAVAVRDWFAAHGFTGRIQTVGHGETRPVADNGTVEGRQLNRRVEIVIETGRSG